MHDTDSLKEFQIAVTNCCLLAANLEYYLEVIRPVDHDKVREVLEKLDDMLDELKEQAYHIKSKD